MGTKEEDKSQTNEPNIGREEKYIERKDWRPPLQTRGPLWHIGTMNHTEIGQKAFPRLRDLPLGTGVESHNRGKAY